MGFWHIAPKYRKYLEPGTNTKMAKIKSQAQKELFEMLTYPVWDDIIRFYFTYGRLLALYLDDQKCLLIFSELPKLLTGKKLSQI